MIQDVTQRNFTQGGLLMACAVDELGRNEDMRVQILMIRCLECNDPLYTIHTFLKVMIHGLHSTDSPNIPGKKALKAYFEKQR